MAGKLVGRYKNAPERRMNTRHLAAQKRLLNQLAQFSDPPFLAGSGIRTLPGSIRPCAGQATGSCALALLCLQCRH